MIEESEQLNERLEYFPCRPNQSQNETPRDAHLTAHRSIGAALHTLDHQFSKSGCEKSSQQDANPSRGTEVSQGGLLFEFTALRLN